jgi:hypothetical protein
MNLKCLALVLANKTKIITACSLARWVVSRNLRKLYYPNTKKAHGPNNAKKPKGVSVASNQAVIPTAANGMVRPMFKMET